MVNTLVHVYARYWGNTSATSSGVKGHGDTHIWEESCDCEVSDDEGTVMAHRHTGWEDFRDRET